VPSYQTGAAGGPVVGATIAASVLAAMYVASGVTGTDLAAQAARAEFFHLHGPRPVDFGWYGGVFPYGYSLLTGPLNAAVGARWVGALAAVVGAAAFAYLLVKTQVRRPLLGGLLGAACMVFDVVSGRTTFAVGLALGLLALCLLPRGRPAGARPSAGARRSAAVAGMAALSAGASPVAGVFLVIAGLALTITGRRLCGVLLMAGSAAPLLLIAMVFSDGGFSPFSAGQAAVFVVLTTAVAVAVPGRYLAVRVGAVLTAVTLIAGHLAQTPLGGNTARLPLLFAIPIVAATAELPGVALAIVIAAMLWWQPPLVTSDVTSAGARGTRAAFFSPLVDQLQRRQPLGRIEIVPLRDHWEAAYVAESVVPVARGWERQADVGRNRLFYSSALTAPSYWAWLRDNAVAMVAVPRGQRLDPAGVREGTLVGTGLPYLQLAWSSADWRLYTVRDAQRMVSPPGRMMASDAAGVTFTTDRPARLMLRLRFSRWVTLFGPAGACLGPRLGWTSVTVTRAGRYRVSSTWHLRPSRRC